MKACIHETQTFILAVIDVAKLRSWSGLEA